MAGLTDLPPGTACPENDDLLYVIVSACGAGVMETYYTSQNYQETCRCVHQFIVAELP